MKQKDIALIIFIGIVSTVILVIISNKIFAPPKNRQQKVEVVQKIDSNFQVPDSRFFNSSQFDPTQPINVSQSANTGPFNTTTP